MSRCLKRLTITAAINKALRFPPLFRIYNKSTHFVLSLLRSSLSSFIRFMDSLMFSHEDDDVLCSSSDQSFFSPTFADPGESIYLVPFRWWREAVCGGGSRVSDGMSAVGGVLYNATVQLDGWGNDDGGDDVNWGFGDSDILVGMSREGEARISGELGVYDGEGDLALVSEWMFFTALKWHYDKKDMESSLPGQDTAGILFPLQIRLLYMRETRQLLIKICQKDNVIGAFNKAYNVFFSKSEMFQVWDFSGQTNHFFVNGSLSSMGSAQSYEEILLQLHIYGLSYTIFNDKEARNGEMIVEQSATTGPLSSSSFSMNGSVDGVNLFSRVPPSIGPHSGFDGTCALGLTGLLNLGNTCFMNSAIQCLVHTPKLVDYFLGNFRKDLNCENPLGMNGKLAIAFGDLLRKLWAPGATVVAPRMFKSIISSFARQFSGYGQHDSQEFLSFLLDGLHEDLNRVKRKPYIEAKEDGRPDEEVAEEYWENHLSRNDSIIVDLCQGQYRSSLVCPVCKKLSVTFDPFMYLSLPVPSSTMRKMTLAVFSTDGTNLPHSVTVTVPHKGTTKDLVDALGVACSLRDDETLLIAEIYNSSIFRILDELGDSLELIRDDDRLVAYRLPGDNVGYRLVVFTHQHVVKSCFQSSLSFKKFGVPLVAKISDFSKGSEIQKEFLKLINPFLLPTEEFLINDSSHRSAHEDKEIEDVVLEEASDSKNEFENDSDAQSNFDFFLETGRYPSGSKIQMDKLVPVLKFDKPVEVLVSWSEKMIRDYDTSILSVLPVVCETVFLPKWTQDSVSLYKCLDAFLKEEPLGPDDMWYCPNCKEHREAIKKLDLWRLPEILVIHLKRFSYTRFLKNKLETFVDFPVDEFDISNYLTQKNKACHRYSLYAISNHYGGMGGGHYTAFAKHRLSRWYEFDDTRVFPVSEEQIKTQAAYVLFYKRI